MSCHWHTIVWISAWCYNRRVASWDCALSARPNDAQHQLFYVTAAAAVAAIWPKAHNLSLSLSIPFTLLLNSIFFTHLSLSLSQDFYLSRSPVHSQHILSISIFLHLNIHYHPSFTSSSFLCGSLPWCSFYGQQPQAPHMSWSGLMCFRGGMNRWVGEGPRGARAALHQNNMSHSSLMTSTIQPCRALTVQPHPEGSCNMTIIHLFHAQKLPCFVITWFPGGSMTTSVTSLSVWTAKGVSFNFNHFTSEKNYTDRYIFQNIHYL